MSNAASAKGNPAHTRMSNKSLKERRQSSWTRGEKRKDQRRATQKAAEAVNNILRKLGQPTEWQAAQEARAARRTSLRERWAAQHR